MWFTIINPTSGNGKSLKKLNLIKKQFQWYQIPVHIVFTSYKHHEKILVQEAIKNNYTKFISVGGDGTLHHIVNGIMQQNQVKNDQIKVAVIPVGTGNDWVKTYGIPKNIKKAIALIKEENTRYQDIGKIKMLSNNKVIFFNNAAGIGFDGYVVHRISSFKKLGSIAYLLAGLSSFFSYNKSNLQINIDGKKMTSKIFMITIGLGKFSGGGLQLTDYKNNISGSFDITLIKDISLKKVLININKLFNGKIIHLKEVDTFHAKSVKINLLKNEFPFLQADGELLGSANSEINILKNAIQFVMPNVKY